MTPDRRGRADLAAVLGLGLAAFVAFGPGLSPDRVFFERDIANYWYGQIASLVRAVGERAWPLWSADAGFGLPMWEDANYQIAYPPNWLCLLLLPATYFKVFAIGHCWVGGVGLYAYLRAWPMKPLPSFMGGATWALSGPFLSAMSLGHHYAAAAWIGWVLFGLVLTLERRNVASALALGGCAAILALAGSAEVVVMAALMALVVMIVRCGLAPIRDLGRARWLALAIAFGGLLSLVQWLPTIAYVRDMPTRLALAVQDTFFWSMHPASAVDFLVPSLVADLPWNDATRGWLFEGRESLLQSLYLGVAAIGLALLARRNRLAGAGGVLVVILLLTALGQHVPGVWSLVARSGISIPFRFPIKALIGLGVPFGMLVAGGMECWLEVWDAGRRRRGQIAAGALMLLALAAGFFAWRISRGALTARLDPAFDPATLADATHMAVSRLCTAAAIALAAAILFVLRASRPSAAPWMTVAVGTVLLADLGAAGMTVNAVAPRLLLEALPPVLQKIDKPWSHRRVQATFDPSVLAASRHRLQGPVDWTVQWTGTYGQQEWISPPNGLRWGLSGAYDGDLVGLTPVPVPLMSALLTSGDERLRRRLLQIGAVEYLEGILAQPPSASSGLTSVAAVPSVFGAPVLVYRVAETMPRAYVVGRSRIVAETDAALRQILDPAFDPRSEVVLASGRPLVSAGAFQGSARIVGRRADRVSIDTEASHDGYVVLVESYAPSWRATVDGAAAEVVRANAAFRAVAVPAGHHRVEMSYFPRSVVWGLTLTGGALMGALAWAVWHGTRSRA